MFYMYCIIVFTKLLVPFLERKYFFQDFKIGINQYKLEVFFLIIIELNMNVKKKLIKFTRQKKLLEVSSFNNKRFKLVIDNFPLINEKRVVINAFQCLKI